MLFYQLDFLIPFLLFLLVYHQVGLRAQNILILGMGYFFYGMWDWRFLSLLLITTVIDYAAGLLVDRQQDPLKRKLLVALSMAVNLGMLGFFKYFNFFADTFVQAFNISASGEKWVNVILPAGISFYTFQSMSYVIDVYRRHIPAERNFLNFAAFVSYFPHLVAGPIQRAEILLAQIVKDRQLTLHKYLDGTRLFAWGLFKKLVVGDNMATLVDPVFLSPSSYDQITLLFAAYAFAIQIYCDFSGYTDMARGISRMMGIELTLNFNLPYFSTSLREFWRRWHISLSTWFRDYVYITLGGSHNRLEKTIRNLLITFLLSGIWHGAGWTFIVWGLYHGLLVSAEMAFANTRIGVCMSKVPRWIKMVLTFHLVTLGWIVFRAPQWHIGRDYIRRLFDWNLPSWDTILATEDWFDFIVTLPDTFSASGWDTMGKFVFFAMPLLVVEIIEYRRKKVFWDYDLKPVSRALLYSFFILMFFIFSIQDGKQFIYFQF